MDETGKQLKVKKARQKGADVELMHRKIEELSAEVEKGKLERERLLATLAVLDEIRVALLESIADFSACYRKRGPAWFKH